VRTTSLTSEILAGSAAACGIAPFGAVVRSLDDAATGAAIEPDGRFYPASMIKTPLALAAYAAVADGSLALADTFEVTAANMTLNDKPSPLVPGYRSPLSELIELMITRSDNVATNMLYDILGRERATHVVQQQFGLTKTAFFRKLSGSLPLIHDSEWDGEHLNTHPPSDAAKLFELIARERVPHSNALRKTLERQEWNNKLSEGLEPGDRFAHKTGDTDEVTHDGGILQTAQGRSYVIVVFTGMESNDSNNAKFAPFMRTLRPFL
jgi:beta-lactamase class A